MSSHEQPDRNALESAQEAAREMAWKWFEYHAGQRLSVFRFYLIIVAFISAGYVSAALKVEFTISCALAFILLVFSFLFYRLDCRTKNLVKVGEKYLKEEQERLFELIGSKEIELVKMADEAKDSKYLCSFRQVNNFIFSFISIIAVAALLYAAARTGVGVILTYVLKLWLSGA